MSWNRALRLRGYPSVPAAAIFGAVFGAAFAISIAPGDDGERYDVWSDDWGRGVPGRAEHTGAYAGLTARGWR
jgi:hypothetical protein